MMVLSRGYQERLDQYFLANDIDEGKKVPALLSLVGASAYRLLRDIFSPDLPSTKDFPTLCDKSKSHYAREPLVIAERFRFYKRDQKPDETSREFNVVLRKLSEYCKFGVNLNDSLRDQFVCGLKSESIQKKLLTVCKLIYNKAIETALGMESANKYAGHIQGKPAPLVTTEVNKLNSQGGKKKKKKD